MIEFISSSRQEVHSFMSLGDALVAVNKQRIDGLTLGQVVPLIQDSALPLTLTFSSRSQRLDRENRHPKDHTTKSEEPRRGSIPKSSMVSVMPQIFQGSARVRRSEISLPQTLTATYNRLGTLRPHLGKTFRVPYGRTCLVSRFETDLLPTIHSPSRFAIMPTRSPRLGWV